ncbi:MAG: 4Fe-4S dicluster domain-containing protein [Blautia wexlerae]
MQHGSTARQEKKQLHSSPGRMAGRKSANECVKCGKCEEVCPQHIKIRDELEKIAAELLG